MEKDGECSESKLPALLEEALSPSAVPRESQQHRSGLLDTGDVHETADFQPVEQTCSNAWGRLDVKHATLGWEKLPVRVCSQSRHRAGRPSPIKASEPRNDSQCGTS
ncbi:unnamed protein product [Pleuronectes platessa]|uniref:Uncharacterized protein n=1 Tax=Pleuronectes platessa TaxID=8262 RepID=A0A9N7VVB1_PLEPL|nr:unnamed protein product [Pleuronectes platessa]